MARLLAFFAAQKMEEEHGQSRCLAAGLLSFKHRSPLVRKYDSALLPAQARLGRPTVLTARFSGRIAFLTIFGLWPLGASVVNAQTCHTNAPRYDLQQILSAGQ